MSIPESYRSFYRIFLRFSMVMILAGLLMGILFQESSKKAPVSDILPAGPHLESIFSLSLVHGHTFIIGALIPLAITWMLYLGLKLGYQPLSDRSLRWGGGLYLPSATIAVLLMLYKGYHYLLGVRGGQLDFTVLDASLFFGSHALRSATYGLTHTAMAVGLSILVIGFWKSMRQPKSAT
jgi:hypothetical protein